MDSFNAALSNLYVEAGEIGGNAQGIPNTHLLFAHLTELRIIQLHQSITGNTSEDTPLGLGGDDIVAEKPQKMSAKQQSMAKLFIEQLYRVRMLVYLRKQPS
jgi:hypothetical protein